MNSRPPKVEIIALPPRILIYMEASDRLTRARYLAEEIQRGQTDKLKIPYIYHVLDVAKRVKHLGEEIEIVGLLHDAVEDAPPDRRLTLDEIEMKFGKDVRDGVDGMTKREGEEYYTEYLPRLISNHIAQIVKIADSSHNISKAHLIPELKEQEKLRNKYAAALEVLGVDPIQAEVPLVFSEGPDFTGWTCDRV